jgi:hypothetical protein
VLLRLSTLSPPAQAELPELSVVCDVLNRRSLGHTIVSAEAIPPGGSIVVRDRPGIHGTPRTRIQNTLFVLSSARQLVAPYSGKG